MQFQCLMNPPKYLVRMKKHRFTFALNETETWAVVAINDWVVKDTWVMAKIRGENVSEDVVGQLNGYKVDRFDKTIYIVLDALAGEKHVEALLKAHMRADFLDVEIEETEAPYGLETRTNRKTDWTTR